MDLIRTGGRLAPLVVAIALAALVSLPVVTAAQEEAGGSLPSGLQAEMLFDLGFLEQKMVGLAEAIPADKYDWSPADGVRSVSATLMHVVTADHRLLAAVGRPAPEGLEEMAELSDKEAVIAELTAAFAAVKETIESTDVFTLEEEVELFGRKWSKRAVLYLIATHSHEHLGQMIAYARTMGVTPPWSAQPAEADEE